MTFINGFLGFFVLKFNMKIRYEYTTEHENENGQSHILT